MHINGVQLKLSADLNFPDAINHRNWPVDTEQKRLRKSICDSPPLLHLLRLSLTQNNIVTSSYSRCVVL